MAKKTETTAPKEKKQYTYVVKSTKPLDDGNVHKLKFVDKRTVKQEGEV